MFKEKPTYTWKIKLNLFLTNYKLKIFTTNDLGNFIGHNFYLIITIT